MRQAEEGRVKRPYKVWDSGRQIRKGLVASSFTELIERGREKLDLGEARIRVVLEADGTQVEDPEYFTTLPENTVFLLLRQGEHWYPAGVEVLRQAITAIPRIVCETIYSLGLHDEAPVWKVMDQYGKITVVLSWDPCHHRGEAHKHGTSPRKPSATPRVLVSGVGESTTQRHELLTAQTSFGSTTSPLPAAKSPVPTAIGAPSIPGTVTTILRDGKKETLINDVGPGTVINHDTEHKISYMGAGAAGVVVGRLSRQGSSVESAHSATVHIHTPECCAYGHPTPTVRTRVSPTGEQSECDFHCCSLHEESGRIQASRQQQQVHQQKHHHSHQGPSIQHQSSQEKKHAQSTGPSLQQQSSQEQSNKTVATSPIQEVQEKRPVQPPPQPSPVGKSGVATQKPGSHVRFLADYHSTVLPEKPKEAESSESETENTTNDEEVQTCEKFLLLIDQPSTEKKTKRNLSIKDIGVILDRLSSKIVDVERLEREVEDECFNWTIKAVIRGDSLRELGVLYGGHYYTICEHPAYGSSKPEEEDEEQAEDDDDESTVKGDEGDPV